MLGKLFVTLGAVALLVAGLLLLAIALDHNGGSWFPNLMDSFFYPASAIFAGAGILSILLGRRSIREERELREFDKSMSIVNRSNDPSANKDGN